jgi:hypothetical protein
MSVVGELFVVKPRFSIQKYPELLLMGNTFTGTVFTLKGKGRRVIFRNGKSRETGKEIVVTYFTNYQYSRSRSVFELAISQI